MAAKKEFLYQSVAQQIAGQIRDGVYGAGSKLPSISQLKKKLNLSVSTLFRAYVELEQMGLVEARPRSGYYVRPRSLKQGPLDRELPVYNACKDQPFLLDVIRMAIENPQLIPFGRAAISPSLFPRNKMAAIAKAISAKTMERLMTYGPIKGNLELRRQLAKRMLGLADRVSPERILITNGCREAVAFSLMAVTSPGDTIAVESPTFFGYMDILRELNLSIVEIPTSPKTGIDLRALENAMDTRDIKTCLLIPNFHNPLGFVMPDENKQALVRLTNERGIPVVEDDIYSELYFGRTRPSLLASFDQEGLVITCSSFSKTLSPGFRVGWILAAPSLLARMEQIKLSISMSTTNLDQYFLAEFMAGNGYDRHLRSMRFQFKKQIASAVRAIKVNFPEGTRCRIPDGGMVLWVRLPEKIDSMELYHQAMAVGIAILPGPMCSFSGKFKTYIRINCGFPHGPEIADGFKRLGRLAKSLPA